jgi:FKBP-type peptidyl-prolyl isomerase-like protein
MNSRRVPSSLALLACAASLVMTLAACSSDTDTSTASTASTTEAATSSVAEPATSSVAEAAATCPTAAPQNGGTPDWTLSGATGSIAVTGSTDAAAPYVHVGAPFSVTDTQVHTLKAGDGPVVADTATVSVCYMGVNGRDGSVFDSSFERGAPVEFPLDGVVKGFQKAIAGQKVGSTVAVAMTASDGYPDGQPSAGIQKGDSLVFAIKILDATS